MRHIRDLTDSGDRQGARAALLLLKYYIRSFPDFSVAFLESMEMTKAQLIQLLDGSKFSEYIRVRTKPDVIVTMSQWNK